MKIVYIFNSLAYKGGAERIVSEKMGWLADVAGHDVTAVTCHQSADSQPNTYPLSPRVRQVNLSIPFFRQYQYHYPRRLWVKWHYQRELRRQLQANIDALQPDIVVGMSYMMADVVCHIKTTAPIVIESHEARRYTQSSLLFGNISWLSKIYRRLHRHTYLHTIEKRARVVVTLTASNACEWRKARRVEVIPNFSTMAVSGMTSGDNKRAIAVGRIEWQKGYDRMIDIWQRVTRQHPDWRLDIYGEGTLEKDIQTNIQRRGLTNVSIHPFTPHISEEYATSDICLLTSRFEGFSLVLLEAMRHGVPCVAFDCPYGPAEVVDDGQCGYVVSDGDLQQFADRVCTLIERQDLRATFTKASLQKAQAYDMTTIMRQWDDLFRLLAKDQHDYT